MTRQNKQTYSVDGLARKGWLAELQAAGLEPGPARHTPWTTDGDYDDTKSSSFSSSMLWDFVECRAR
jgi:hypothetical protein